MMLDNDSQWVTENYDKLRKYEGKVIAVKNQKIIEVSDTLEHLLKKLEEKKGKLRIPFNRSNSPKRRVIHTLREQLVTRIPLRMRKFIQERYFPFISFMLKTPHASIPSIVGNDFLEQQKLGLYVNPSTKTAYLERPQ